MKNERRTLINESWVLAGEMHTIKRMVLFALCLLVLGSTQPLLADITNGYFSGDLSDWNWTPSEAYVFYDYGEDENDGWAVLTVDDKIALSYSTLSQGGIELESSDKWLSFEFEMIGETSETDEFTATFGPPSPIRSYTFSSDDPRFVDDSYHRETVTFPLTGLDTGPSYEYELLFTLTNLDSDDTTTFVHIDTVQLSPVPVPGAVVLGSIGLSFSGWLLRRRRASH